MRDATHSVSGEPPVLIVGFARIENILEIAEIILRDQPCCLFIQMDGGRFRQNSPEIRKMLSGLHRIAGSTQIKLSVEDLNVGIATNLTKGVSAALFEHKSVIVLEDDCYPSPLFYKFAAAALARHAQNQTIGMITGNAYINYPPGPLFAEVSTVPLTWGWGTWRDRWQGFDQELSNFTFDEIDVAISRSTRSPLIRSHWRHRVRESLNDRNMWDAQWAVYMWLRGYTCLNPSINLVSNRGVDDAATHTQSSSIFTDWPSSTLSSLSKESKMSLAFPIRWSRARKFRHLALLRLDLLRSMLESLGVPGRRIVISTLQKIIATTKRPKS